jgi:AAA+ superfamily predicted ATPase
MNTLKPSAVATDPAPDALGTLLRQRAPLVLIETHEEQAAIQRLQALLSQVLRPLYSSSITRGLRRLDLVAQVEQPPEFAPSSNDCLDFMQRTRDRSIFVLFEFDAFLGYAINQRKFRELVLRNDCAEHTIILVSPKFDLPASILDLAVRAPMPLPSQAQLLEMIKTEASQYAKEQSGRRVQLILSSVNAMVRMLHGLPMADARRIAQHVIANDGKISDADLPEVANAKFELVEKSGVLSFERESVTLEDIAGLDNLKRWITQRRAVFIGANDAQLDPPRGVLLLGVQGCGKSMAAKAVAAGFKVPLLRLDMGSIYDKYHGESERKLRESLNQAAKMSPCVLWIDEIEKAMAQSTSDDGVSRRVLGYFLTWLNERKAPVFAVATANQIDLLPPELLRKGRFDEIFFVDLPRASARRRAFEIHLARRKFDIANFDLDALAQASQGFSGAEIEQAIIAGNYSAHAANQALNSEWILQELSRTKPLSVVMAEPIQALRTWASTRTVSADSDALEV